MKTLLFPVRSYEDGHTMFWAEIDADDREAPWGVLLGRAVQWAVGAGRSLAGADLEGAELEGCDLHGQDLSWTSLRGANLKSCNLEGANLTGADMSAADMRDVHMAGAVTELSKADDDTIFSGHDRRPSFARLQ
jgi:hypothetical protein